MPGLAAATLILLQAGTAAPASGPAPAIAPAPLCVPSPRDGHEGARADPHYLAGEKPVIGGRRFTKYGLSRMLTPGAVRYYDMGWPHAFFYVETGLKGRPEVIYLLLDRKSCEFQPYVLDE